MSFRVSFQTLGCKLNQLETESITQAFLKEGFSIVSWGSPADIYIVNTCTVTSMAEQKARREIRKVLRDRPAACVVATGCYAQLDPEAIASIADEIDGVFSGGGEGHSGFERRRITVVSGDLKSSLIDLPSFINDSACSSSELPETINIWASGRKIDSGDPFRFDANDFAFHSRASLKIQDGCDNRCAYCRVRLARGGSVSLAAPEILSRLRHLEAKGYAEAVLTGINLTRYRSEDGTDFAGLLRFLIEGTKRIALRISSTEPDGVNGRFAEIVSHARIRPHFHLSVQSGSDEILKRMRRGYDAEQVLKAADLLTKAKGDPFLACDMIAGFPGETASDFEESFRLCETIGFAWIHAFSFSPRPGTEAATLSGRVPERETALRVERLTGLAQTGRDAYIGRWIGKTVEAVVEGRRADGTRRAVSFQAAFPALSENYLKLSVEHPSSSGVPSPGTLIRCRIRETLPVSDPMDGKAELLEIIS